MNIMIDENNQPYVIDWGLSTIGDFRLDLSWTILLYSTFGGPMFRSPMIEFYHRISGKKIENLEFYEVIAGVRRITDLIRTVYDVDSVGLKPEVLNLIKNSREHFLRVHGFIEERTGIRLKELDEMLNSFD